MLSVSVCNGEAVPDSDRLHFSIRGYDENIPRVKVTPAAVVAPVVPPEGPVALSAAEQVRLGLVPITKIQVQGVMPALYNKQSITMLHNDIDMIVFAQQVEPQTMHLQQMV